MPGLANIISGTRSSNRSSLRLLERGDPVSLDKIVKMQIQLDDGTVIDSEEYPLVFDWREEPKGVLRLFLGRADYPFDNRVYNAKLFVYDWLNHLGIYWGDFRIRKIDNGTTPL